MTPRRSDARKAGVTILVILAIIIGLLLSGCSPRQPKPINGYASVRIHLVPLEEIHARFPELYRPGAVTDFRKGTDIWLPSDTSKEDLVRMTAHELLKHVVPDADPALRIACLVALGRMYGHGFDCVACAEEARSR